MSKKMFSRERERGKLRFSALLILIGLLLFGCDPTMVTITYNANGGKGEMKPQAVESGVEVKLNANTFTKDGSDFTGWNEAKDGSGKAYADGATVAPTGNLTLYAQWQVKSTPENPGTEDPGTEDPDPENPGTEDPESPVDRENHITNLALIYVVEQTYPEFGWTKTAEGYVDMTNETNKTLVAGVTSLATNGDMYLDGIEYFTGLQELTLLNNSVLTELPDLTSLSNLRILAVTTFESTADSDLTAVSSLTAVSGLPASLEELDLSENKLTALDVSKLTKLEELDLSENKLTAISDLPVSLKRLKLYTNKLTALNVSELTNLTYLDVSDNELTELDITKNTQLTLLLCFNNRMTALDITNVTAFSQDPLPSTSILACGLQRNDSGRQELILTATQAQKTALAPLFPSAENPDEQLTFYQASNFDVVWNVPGAELDIDAGTAVFDATSGLKLPFTVGNTGALTEEELTELLASATKTVTLFTADNETGTQVQVGHISHGVDTATPYILVVAEAFPQGSNTYSKIEVVLEAEGYVTQTLTYTDVSVNVPGAELGITAGTAVFNKTNGLTLPVEGQTIPNGADVLVSLGGTQVNSEHISFNADRSAVIVALAGLTNDTVDMTVTVTVSAEGYNNEVLTYEGVNTVWMPENVTAALEAVSPENTFIEGEVLTVTLTADGESTGKIKITSAEVDGTDISFTDSTITVPNAEGGPVTLTLGKDGTEETVSAAVELAEIYDSTHVRYDGRIFQQVKGFDFSTENTAKTAGVQIFEQKTAEQSNSWEEDLDWSGVQYISGEGYQFATTSSSGGMRFVFPETDSDLDFELIMVEAKWNNNSQANLHMSYWYESQKTYGYSFYKTGKSFFMVGNYNFAEGHGFDADVTENTFNRFYAFDDGTDHSGRVNDGEVHSFTVSAPDNRTLDTLDKLQLEFSQKVDCTYTLKTVNFYKPVQ